MIKENNKRNIGSISLVALALFSISLLINLDMNFPLQKVYALGLSRINVTYIPQASFYQESTGILWVLANGAIGSSDANVYLIAVEPDDNSIIHTKNLYTDMQNLNGTNISDTDLDGQDLWCGITWCYVTLGRSILDVTTFQNADLDDGVILLVDATGTVFPTANPVNSTTPELGNILAYYQHTTGGVWNIEGRDDSCDIEGCVGGTSLWVEFCDEVFNGITCDPKIHLVSGNLDLISFQGVNGFPRLTDLVGFSFSDFNTNTRKYHDIKWTGNRGTTENYLVTIGGLGYNPAATTTNSLNIYNVASNTLVCGDPSTAGADIAHGAYNLALDNARDRIFIGGNTGNIHVYDYSCALVATYNSTITGLGQNVKSVLYLEDYDYVIAQEDGSNGHVSIMEWNGTLSINQEVLNTFPSASLSSILSREGTYNTDRRDAVFFPQSSANDGVLRWDIAEPVNNPDTGGEEVCVEITEGGSLVCYEDTDGNGIPNFPNGSFDALRPPTQNVTTIGASLTCAIGFNDAACENDNPRENGVGLLLLLILVIVSYSFLVSIHIGAVKVLNRQNVAVMDYLNINPVLLLVMLIIDVGAAFYMQWIPDIIFYTVVVVMGGLAAWGYFSAIKGRGSSA